MTKGKVDQSTEENLTGHTLLKSISFKGQIQGSNLHMQNVSGLGKVAGKSNIL